MGRFFAIVNVDTGKPDGENPRSGIYEMPDNYDPEAFGADDEGYMLVELTQEECMQMTYLNIQDNKADFRNSLDTGKATRKLADRAVADVPIEAEGIGGKEIIAVEEKPVGLIVKRSPSPKRVT